MINLILKELGEHLFPESSLSFAILNPGYQISLFDTLNVCTLTVICLGGPDVLINRLCGPNTLNLYFIAFFHLAFLLTLLWWIEIERYTLTTNSQISIAHHSLHRIDMSAKISASSSAPNSFLSIFVLSLYSSSPVSPFYSHFNNILCDEESF